MKKGLLTVATGFALLLASSLPAQAQPLTTQMPTFELGAGYQLLRGGEVCDPDDDELCTDGYTYPFGLAIDGVWNLNGGPFGLVAEGGWSRHSEEIEGFPGVDGSENLFHYAAGVRWTGRGSPTVWPYAQVLVGGIYDRFSVDEDETGGLIEDDSINKFMLQPGVGVTFVTGDGWGIFGQVDYRRMFLDKDEEGSGRNDFRVFIGARMILD